MKNGELMNEGMFKLDHVEIARRQAAREFAVMIQRTLLGNMSPEEVASLANHAEQLLKGYEAHLEAACKRFQDIAEEAINCTVRPLVIR